MNCKSFQALSPREQMEFIGKLVVAVQSSETFFSAGKQITEAAEAVGVFNRVKVGHQVFDDNSLAHEVYQ